MRASSLQDCKAISLLIRFLCLPSNEFYIARVTLELLRFGTLLQIACKKAGPKSR